MKEFSKSRNVCAFLGLSAVGLFIAAYVICSLLTPDFDILNDYVSQLGANGQPYAVWWNAIGFFTVGCVAAAFGFTLGSIVDDAAIKAALTVSGIGFALAALPTDMLNVDSSLSKAHFVSICLALAGWCIGMARIGCLPSDSEFEEFNLRASVASVLVVIPMVGYGVGVIAMPVAHRLALSIVFGWIVYTSLDLFAVSKRE